MERLGWGCCFVVSTLVFTEKAPSTRRDKGDCSDEVMVSERIYLFTYFIHRLLSTIALALAELKFKNLYLRTLTALG
jgi:hypothetical protein